MIRTVRIIPVIRAGTRKRLGMVSMSVVVQDGVAAAAEVSRWSRACAVIVRCTAVHTFKQWTNACCTFQLWTCNITYVNGPMECIIISRIADEVKYPVLSLRSSIMTYAHRAHLALTLPSLFPRIRVLYSLYLTSAACPENIFYHQTDNRQNRNLKTTDRHTICTRPRSTPAISAALIIATTLSGVLVK
jgi:hypothetical protein